MCTPQPTEKSEPITRRQVTWMGLLARNDIVSVAAGMSMLAGRILL